MKKVFNCFVILFFTLMMFFSKAVADCVFEADGRTITFDEDKFRFYEDSIELTQEEVQKIFPEYKILTISDFDKNKKYFMKNSLFGKKKILILNDRNRTFHLFYIYPVSARDGYKDKKPGEIKSLITVYGKKNVRLKHSGGDEFEIVVK